MAKLKYSIKAENNASDKTEVSVRGFNFIVDEPENAGGENLGPTPVEYLLGALAGCMGVVCNKVAKEMNITLNHVSFEIEGDLDTDKFMGKDMEKRSGYTEIRVKINADLNCDTQAKFQWLKAVKERCPVSDNLSNITPIKVKLV